MIAKEFFRYRAVFCLLLLSGCKGGADPTLDSLKQVFSQQTTSSGTSSASHASSGNKNVDTILRGADAAQSELQALSITSANEDAIGQSVGVSLLGDSPTYNDPKLQTYVSLVGLTMATASSNPGGNYVFAVLDRPDINAFSGPNGYIFITRGALAQMKDEAELAGVLGHEIAHVCNHDGLHQVQLEAQRTALAKSLQVASPNDRLATLTNVGVDVITKSGYDQPQEDAADAQSVAIMRAAGYDPQSYLRFLQRLQTMQSSSSAVQIMSTHPGIGHRIENVQARIDKLHASGGATLADRFAANVTLK